MIGVNLIPAARVLARRRRRRVRLWAAVVTATCCLGAVPMALEFSRDQKVQALKTEHRASTAEIEKTTGLLNKLGIDVRHLESQIARAEALRTKRSWARLIGVVAQSLTEEVWLTSIATDPPIPRRGIEDLREKTGVADPSKKDGETVVVTLQAPQVLTIDGYAIEQGDVWNFVTRLTNADVFRTVRFRKSAVESMLEGTAVKFQIVCDWSQGSKL